MLERNTLYENKEKAMIPKKEFALLFHGMVGPNDDMRWWVWGRYNPHLVDWNDGNVWEKTREWARSDRKTTCCVRSGHFKLFVAHVFE